MLSNMVFTNKLKDEEDKITGLKVSLTPTNKVR